MSGLKQRYRVIEGRHIELVPDGQHQGAPQADGSGGCSCDCFAQTGSHCRKGAPKYKRTLYGKGCRAGDVFESSEDMTGTRFCPPGMTPKFVLAEDPRLNSREAIVDKLAELKAKLAEIDQRDQQQRAQMAAEASSAAVKGEAGPAVIQQAPPTPLRQAPPQTRQQAEAAYRKMSEQELRQAADNVEVDVSKCKTKDDLVKALLA